MKAKRKTGLKIKKLRARKRVSSQLKLSIFMVVGVVFGLFLIFITVVALQTGSNPFVQAATNQGSGGLLTTQNSPTPTSKQLPQLGFTIHVGTVARQDRQAYMQQLAAIGTKWIRTGAPWYLLQPSNSTSWSSAEWADLDATVNAATSSGINVLFQLDEPPAWASDLTQQSNIDAFGSYGKAVFKRYQHKGPGGANPVLEVFNEKNDMDPSLYTKLTCSVHTNVKGVDKKALVIGGSENMYATYPTAPTWQSWFTAIYQNGIGKCLEAVSAHDYYDLTADSSTDLNQIHSMMTQYGDGNKPVWLTEFGASTCPGPIQPGGCYTEQGQSDKIINTIKTLQASYPYIPVSMVYTDRDQAELYTSNAFEANFGVFHVGTNDYITTPKPAATALKQLYLP